MGVFARVTNLDPDPRQCLCETLDLPRNMFGFVTRTDADPDLKCYRGKDAHSNSNHKNSGPIFDPIFF